MKTMGMLRVIQAFLPQMAKDGSGRIINISGVAGTSVWVPALTHGLNNSAMNHATSYLAQDLAGDKITVNAVSPGLVGTEGREVWAENMAKQQGKTKAEFVAEFCKRMGILSGRWAEMDEVASAVVYLASDRGALHHRHAVVHRRRLQRERPPRVARHQIAPGHMAENRLTTRTVGAARRSRQSGNRVGGAEIRRRSRTCGMPQTDRRRRGFPRRRPGSRQQPVLGRWLPASGRLPVGRGTLKAAV